MNRELEMRKFGIGLVFHFFEWGESGLFDVCADFGFYERAIFFYK